MDFKDELKLLAPLPLSIEGRGLSNLTLRQVLTYLSCLDNHKELQEFLEQEHGFCNEDLLKFYNGCSLLLSFPQEEITSKSVSTLKEESKDLLIITSAIHAISSEFNSSFQEILNMNISHYHLCLKFVKSKREQEIKELDKNKRS